MVTSTTTDSVATDDYAGSAIPDTVEALGSDRRNGLTSGEAVTRLAGYGPNEIKEHEEPVWHQVFRRFWNPIAWMIEIAAILSAIVHRWEDLVIILVMLFVNAGIDFFQEHRALNAVKALQSALATQTTVLRDGTWGDIPSQDLVPGDIITLKIGDIVPADVQLMDGAYLLLDQSSLTGESLPVSKDPGDVAYSKTIVKQGQMTAIVLNTGPHTNFHSMVSLVAKAEREERSHFQQMVIRVGDFLIVITVLLVSIIVLAGMARGQEMVELVRYALVLTIAAIPVALPAVLSVTMAVGALGLAKQQAIVSRLVAIEELAGIDILCSDKTGTLTKNEMRVVDPVALDGHTVEELFLYAVLASREENHDPIELPIFDYAAERFPALDVASYRQSEFVPFDPIRKRTEAHIEHGDEQFTVTKGAPQILLGLTDIPNETTKHLTELIDDQASKGYRTIAVARQTDGILDLVGLIPLIDPPREDSAQLITDLQDHGVEVKMVTGDNLAIAREIGHTLGLDGKVIRSKDLASGGADELVELARILADAIYERLAPDADKVGAQHFADDVAEEVADQFGTRELTKGFITTHESELIELVEGVGIFAEVVPEDKYTIVETLQKGGHIVAMTGDGVNDAPALKKADAGIAVSNATDAARAAADIVLTAPGLGVINEAIRLSRITFERMKSYTLYRVAETIRVIIFMFLAIVAFNFFPLTALMIIVLALLNDIPIIAIAYDNTKTDPNPVRWSMPTLLITATSLGLAGVVSSFGMFFILDQLGYATGLIQAMLFAKLVVAGHGTIYNTRSEGWFWRQPHPSLILVSATFSTAVIGTLIAVYGVGMVAIGWERAAFMWAYALAWFVFNDVVKMGTYKALRRRGIYA